MICNRNMTIPSHFAELLYELLYEIGRQTLVHVEKYSGSVTLTDFDIEERGHDNARNVVAGKFRYGNAILCRAMTTDEPGKEKHRKNFFRVHKGSVLVVS